MKEEPPAAFLLYPSPPSRALSAGEIYDDLTLPGDETGGRPYTVINAVSTLDGRAAVGGKSSPVGAAVDRLLMRDIRCAVDAVLVGAGTLRSENLDLGVSRDLIGRRRANGLADQPLQIVLQGRSPLPESRRLYETAGDRLLVLAPKGVHRGPNEAPARLTVREVAASPASGLPDAGSVLALLGGEEFGVRRLLVEGGPAVNRSFLAGGHVSELFLTLAPGITGEPDAPNIVSDGEPLPGAAREWRLVSAYTADGELYLRYLSRRAGRVQSRGG